MSFLLTCKIYCNCYTMKQGIWQEMKWKSNTQNSKFKTFKPFSHLPDLYFIPKHFFWFIDKSWCFLISGVIKRDPKSPLNKLLTLICQRNDKGMLSLIALAVSVFAGHYGKENYRSGQDMHNFISSGFVTLGRGHLKGNHTTAKTLIMIRNVS